MPYQPPPWPQIIAHRGNSGPAPENTRLAIESAIEIGVDMVEVDVRLTKDGVPVLMHYPHLEHTTTGTGPLAGHTWAEIRQLDAGSWKGSEFTGERVLSLDEVLDLTGNRMPLNLDFKTSDAVAPGIAAVRNAGLTDEVVVSGRKLEGLRRFAAVTSGIGKLLNLKDLPKRIGPGEAREVAHRSIEDAKELGAIGINLRHTLVDAALVASVKEAGLGIWVFTVDQKKRFAELIDMGVTSVTTNWPARMLALAGDRASPGTRGSEA